MADDGFGFNLDLIDGISGPAAAETRSLKVIQGEIKTTEKAMRDLTRQQIEFKEAILKGGANVELYQHYLKKLGIDAAKARAQISELKSAAKDAAGSSPSGGGSMFATMLGANLAARAIERVAAATIHGAIAIGSFVVESAEMKEQSVNAYEAVGAKGEETFDLINRRAREVHMPVREAHKLARDLMLQGLTDTNLIAATIQSRAELMRTGQIAGAEKLQSIVTRSLASGHFDVRGLGGGKGGAEGSARALAGLGVHQADLLGNLAARYKTDVGTIKAMLKAGKVETDVGLAAIDEAISKGSIGKAARRKYGLEDFKTDVINTFETIASNVDLTNFNQALIDMDVALGGLGGKSDGVKDLFQFIVDTGAKVIGFARDVGAAFHLGTLVFELYWLKLQRVEIMGVKVGTMLRKLKEDVEWLATGAVKFALDASGLGKILVGDDAANAEAKRRAREAGVNVAGGVAAGVKAGIPGVEDEAAGVSRAAEQAVRSEAEIHSPSRKFARLGAYMASGLANGFDAGDITATVQATVSSATRPPQSATSGTGNGMSVQVGAIYVGAGHEDGEHLRPLIMSALTDSLEQFALELGMQ